MAACSSMISFLFVISMVFLCSSHAYIFYVGGDGGWTLKPSENYTHWAEKNRFQINDSLVFKYKNGHDSVLVVRKNDYYKCNKDNPIKTFKDGNSTIFKFDKSGPFFFISGHEQNCEKGQKFIIVVLSEHHHHHHGAASPSHPPKAPVHPSPSTPMAKTPPPSPPTKPPFTSPSPTPKHAPQPSHSPSTSPAAKTPSHAQPPRVLPPSPSPAAITPIHTPPVEPPHAHSPTPSPSHAPRVEPPSSHSPTPSPSHAPPPSVHSLPPHKGPSPSPHEAETPKSNNDYAPQPEMWMGFPPNNAPAPAPSAAPDDHMAVSFILIVGFSLIMSTMTSAGFF